MKKWHDIVGTFFHIGKSRWMPGTFGSAAGVGLLTVFSWLKPTWFLLADLIFAAVLFLLGLKAANAIVEETGLKDPQTIVIDEVVGILITFLWIPFEWKTAILGFVFFRFFDIWKPYPIRQIEALPTGWGVMLDDVLAGVYANLLLQITIRLAL